MASFYLGIQFQFYFLLALVEILFLIICRWYQWPFVVRINSLSNRNLLVFFSSSCWILFTSYRQRKFSWRWISFLFPGFVGMIGFIVLALSQLPCILKKKCSLLIFIFVYWLQFICLVNFSNKIRWRQKVLLLLFLH